MREIYRPILERKFTCPIHKERCPPAGDAPLLVTTINSAELIKHASNSFLALKISYANVLADLCEKIGADVKEVTHAMGLDPRIGGQFLQAGLGFGGFCFPKDLQAFVHLAGTVGVDFDILKAAERVNKQRIDRFIEKVHQALWVIKGKRVARLGLAFKANTDDTRFSPALDVAQRLVSRRRRRARHRSRGNFACQSRSCRRLPITKTFTKLLRDAEAVLICTDWDEFRNLDWEKAGNLMARRLVIDGRNICSPQRMRELDFEYFSFGREQVRAAAHEAAR